MKKWISLLLISAMALTMAACGSEPQESKEQSQESSQAEAGDESKEDSAGADEGNAGEG